MSLFRKKEPRTLLDRALDLANQFANDLEYATRRKKRLDRVRVERGVRSVLGIGNAVVQLLSVFFPSARIVAQATRVMSLANTATDVLSKTPQLEEDTTTTQQKQQPQEKKA
jgi:hypothetical protein